MNKQTKLEAVFVAVCLAIALMIAWRFYDWLA
jgi:hypothetical protein